MREGRLRLLGHLSGREQRTWEELAEVGRVGSIEATRIVRAMFRVSATAWARRFDDLHHLLSGADAARRPSARIEPPALTRLLERAPGAVHIIVEPVTV